MRRKKQEEHENSERWLVSYADFITLLFAFFTVLYATSEQNLEKSKDFENSIKKYLIKFGAFGATGPETDQGQKFNTPIQPPLQTFPRGNGESQQQQKRVESLIEENLTKKELEELIKDITDDNLGVRISLNAEKIFPAGSAKFKQEALPSLDKLAEVLKSTNKRIFVEGHTGTKNFKSSAYPSNWELAAARASAITRYYIKIHKMGEQKFVVLSYGRSKPVYDNESVGSNSRVDFLMLSNDPL